VLEGFQLLQIPLAREIGFEEIRDYQLYLINERRFSAESVNQFVSAVKFLLQHHSGDAVARGNADPYARSGKTSCDSFLGQ
jgi:hypothetical protein